MPTHKQLVALGIIGLIVATVIVGAVVYYTIRIKTHGKIIAIGCEVFSDPECQLPVREIDWGEIAPGGYSQVLLYIRSNSTVPANMTMKTSNWLPVNASDYLNLVWDYDGTQIYPQEVRAVFFTLYVDDIITGIYEFSFDITITVAR